MTRDGQVHATFEDAQRYADTAYGALLSKLTRALCGGGGEYTKTFEYVDTHLGDFALLLALKADLLVEDDPDERAKVFTQAILA